MIVVSVWTACNLEQAVFSVIAQVGLILTVDIGVILGTDVYKRQGYRQYDAD